MSSESDSEVSGDQQQEEEESDNSEVEQQMDESDDSDDEEEQSHDEEAEDDEEAENDEEEKSDDDSEEEESDSDAKDEKPDVKPKIPFYAGKEDRKEKYEKLKGKTLYLLFPKKLPVDPEVLETEMKLLCDRIIKVRRPRQPCARFCLLDFDSIADRNKAMTQLKTTEVEGKKLHIKIVKTDSSDFIEKLIATRKKKLAEKRTKKKMEKVVKNKSNRDSKVYSSSVKIDNLPTEATESGLKKLFPDAVETQIVFAKTPQDSNSAIVTFPTPKDATLAKRRKIEMGETTLRINFAGVPRKKKPKKIKKTQQATSDAEDAADEENPKKKKFKRAKESDDDNDASRTESPSKQIKKPRKEFNKDSPKKNFGENKFPAKQFQNGNNDFKRGSGLNKNFNRGGRGRGAAPKRGGFAGPNRDFDRGPPGQNRGRGAGRNRYFNSGPPGQSRGGGAGPNRDFNRGPPGQKRDFRGGRGQKRDFKGGAGQNRDFKRGPRPNTGE